MTDPAPSVSPLPWHRRKSTWLWLVAYLVAVVAIVLGMRHLRQRVLETMDTPQARAEWQKWREAEPNQTDSNQPVKRRPPKSAEPPTVVLLRDYFPVIVTAAIVFGSLLFAAITIAARGALWREHPKR